MARAVAVALALLLAACQPRADIAAPPRSSSPEPSDRPHIEITADHQLKSVQHKDVNGRQPLELVQTAQGTVTIRRTFSETGELLKEEAFLDGKPVPVPKR
jgi:hypothetical protein